MARNFLVFQHTPWEGPGEFLLTAANRHNIQLHIVKVWEQSIPEITRRIASLTPREREILAAARVVNEHYQIPLAVATDGRTAIVLDTVSGKKWREGLDRIPSRQEAEALLNTFTLERLPEKRLEGERLIFRSYDSQNVNRV